MWIIVKEIARGQWHFVEYRDDGKPRWSRIRSNAMKFDNCDRAQEVRRRLKNEGFSHASVVAR
jgi:hypothetical protein